MEQLDKHVEGTMTHIILKGNFIMPDGTTTATRDFLVAYKFPVNVGTITEDNDTVGINDSHGSTYILYLNKTLFSYVTLLRALFTSSK